LRGTDAATSVVDEEARRLLSRFHHYNQP